MMNPTNVFISYPHGDRAQPIIAKFISDLQTNVRVNTWVDSQRIKIGDSLSESIELGILAADYFIYVISSNSIKSNWSNTEFHLAYAKQFKDQNLKIIPVLVERVDIPIPLKSLQCIDLTRDYDRGFQSIIEILSSSTADRLIDFTIDQNIDGRSIIDVTSTISEKLIEHFLKHPEDLKTFDRRKFEALIAELFDGFGYKVELTQKTRDGGRDVIAVKHDEVQIKYLIECKRPDPGTKVGVRPVRELLGVKTDEKATKAILATTAFFTEDALLFFERNKWELEPKDFDGILSWIDKYLSIKMR